MHAILDRVYVRDSGPPYLGCMHNVRWNAAAHKGMIAMMSFCGILIDDIYLKDGLVIECNVSGDTYSLLTHPCTYCKVDGSDVCTILLFYVCRSQVHRCPSKALSCFWMDFAIPISITITSSGFRRFV